VKCSLVPAKSLAFQVGFNELETID
jgi:hypothetical protein